MDQRTTITLPGGVRRITDPAAYVAALEAREKIIQKKANRVHGNPGVGGIFKVDKVSAVYQKPRQTHRPSNHLSAPILGAPTPSHLTRYRIRTGWVLTLQEQQILLMWAKADDRRKDRPALAEHDKSPLSPLPSLISNPPMVIYPRWWWRRKRWHFERSRGIWPDPRHCTGYRWSKIALALHFHKLVLKLSSKRQWRHLPVDDRIAAALLGFSEAIHVSTGLLIPTASPLMPSGGSERNCSALRTMSAVSRRVITRHTDLAKASSGLEYQCRSDLVLIRLSDTMRTPSGAGHNT